MIFIKEDGTDFREFRESDKLTDYLTESQCAAILEARNKVDTLLFTSSYKVLFFDIYVSEYACFVLFEVAHDDQNMYLSNIRGQWFIDEDGNIYVRNGKEKEFITDSVYIFTSIRRDK